MKKEQIQIIVLAGFSLILLAWALQLSSSLKNLRQEKKTLEAKLNQIVKERDFMRARFEELEKRLEEEKKASALLVENLNSTKDMIEELQQKIVNLTKEKENLEKELNVLKTQETPAEETLELESKSPQESPLLRETAPIEEEGSSLLEELPPQF